MESTYWELARQARLATGIADRTQSGGAIGFCRLSLHEGSRTQFQAVAHCQLSVANGPCCHLDDELCAYHRPINAVGRQTLAEGHHTPVLAHVYDINGKGHAKGVYPPTRAIRQIHLKASSGISRNTLGASPIGSCLTSMPMRVFRGPQPKNVPPLTA